MEYNLQFARKFWRQTSVSHISFDKTVKRDALHFLWTVKCENTKPEGVDFKSNP